jgi:hypothetical protein
MLETPENRLSHNCKAPRVVVNGLTGVKVVLVECLALHLKFELAAQSVLTVPEDENLKT